MPDVLLDVGDDLTGIGLVPAPIKVFGDRPELDDEVAGQVLRLDLAALFLPQPDQGGFVVAHDDPGVRTADEVAALPVCFVQTFPVLSTEMTLLAWFQAFNRYYEQ